MKRSGPLRSDPEKVRAWQQRSRKSLVVDVDKQRAWRARSKRINPRNPKRAQESYERNYGSRADWVRQQPCLVAGLCGHRCVGKVQAAHVVARKMGGCGGDRRKQVPLCSAAHREAGEYPQLGRWEGTQRALFEEKYGVSLTEKAREIAEYLDTLGFP